MQIPPNIFKRRLLAGEQQIGIWMSSVSPLLAEMIALIGHDWMLFDTEHAPIDVAGVMPLLQAEAAVCAMRYPPAGIRGVATARNPSDAAGPPAGP